MSSSGLPHEPSFHKLSALGQHQSSEAHHEVHRRWAGHEGSRQLFVDVPTNDFWSLAAPDMAEVLTQMNCPESFQGNLECVPTGSSVQERTMYGPLVVEWGRTKRGTDCVAAIFDEGGAHKVAFLCTAEVVVPGNKPLTALLDRLQFLVSLRYMNKRLRSHAEKVPLPKMTYEEVMEAFDDALKSEGWPSDDPAIPFKLKTKGVKAERVEIVSSLKRSAQLSGSAKAGNSNQQITTQSHHATRAAPSAAERPSSGGSSPLASVITTMESLTLVSPESSSAGKPQPYTTTGSSQSAQHGINNAQLRDSRVTASSNRPQGRRTGSGAAPERVAPRTRSSQRALPDASGSKSATGAAPFPSSSQTANETGTSRSQGSRPREPRSTSSSWSRLPTSSSGGPSAPGAVGSSSPRIAEKEEEQNSGPPRLVRRGAS
ncbi:hypothetical protein OE88DRAFT_1649480 [Heliocybe sulcata]|uniref:Uncharacterized protein n=1 Tax=Heliocybe sulcata TaxID=5364 RepID=A0A5C3MJ34_9AGAM|nr:hypothetical protein OE88DRAFT_1649480 [Heliocybe sulcata]